MSPSAPLSLPQAVSPQRRVAGKTITFKLHAAKDHDLDQPHNGTILTDDDDDKSADAHNDDVVAGANNSTTKRYQWTPSTLALAVPALIGMLADPLLSLMDTAYIGRVGPTELAALGACTSIFHLAFNAFRATTTASELLSLLLLM